MLVGSIAVDALPPAPIVEELDSRPFEQTPQSSGLVFTTNAYPHVDAEAFRCRWPDASHSFRQAIRAHFRAHRRKVFDWPPDAAIPFKVRYRRGPRSSVRAGSVDVEVVLERATIH